MSNRESQKNWRERKLVGQMIVPVVVDMDLVDRLIWRGKLREEDRTNRRAIGAAISRLKFRIVDDEEPPE